MILVYDQRHTTQKSFETAMTPHWELIPVIAKTVVFCSLWFGALDKKLEEQSAEPQEEVEPRAEHCAQS